MKRILIKYTMKSPVSHIGETASTGGYFQTVNTASGRIPVITGNSVRGILRDKGAEHLLNATDSVVKKEIFNVLFSGGNITGAAKNDVERAVAIREHFPFISLFGGGLGNMIMSGNLLCGFLYPICNETTGVTGISSDISWHSLIDEIEFTRTDDTKEDKLTKYLVDVNEEKKAKASTQMRFSVQYMGAGTQFLQEIILLDGSSQMEEAVLYTVLYEWFRTPRIGGMASKGFGVFDAESDEISVTDGVINTSDRVNSLIADYNEFIENDSSQDYFYLLGEVKESGKKADKTD